ncbi:MAG: glycerophosphodiester phosphodiesterase [Anaerolineae bacterium]
MLKLRKADTGRALVMGHRGAEALAPENTMAAFEAGLKAGADMLELDVQLTADGRVIVFHDFALGRKTSDPRWVRDVTWEEIRRLDVGSWFDPRYADQRVPLLEEVLAWAKGRVPLCIDLKTGFAFNHRLEERVVELVEGKQMVDEVVIIAWDQFALRRVKALNPEMATGVSLCGRFVDLIPLARSLEVNWLSLWWEHSTPEEVAQAQQAGLAVNLVMFLPDHSEAVRMGADIVEARDPGQAKATLRELGVL